MSQELWALLAIPGVVVLAILYLHAKRHPVVRHLRFRLSTVLAVTAISISFAVSFLVGWGPDVARDLRPVVFLFVIADYFLTWLALILLFNTLRATERFVPLSATESELNHAGYELVRHVADSNAPDSAWREFLRFRFSDLGLEVVRQRCWSIQKSHFSVKDGECLTEKGLSRLRELVEDLDRPTTSPPYSS